jgi:hypothetical protein
MGVALVGSLLVAGSVAGVAVASSLDQQSHASAGWHARVVAKNPYVRVDGKRMKLTSPDDITRLDGRLFVTWQDGVGPQGQPANNGTGVDFSVITEYTPAGRLVNFWKLKRKCDGLTADPAKGIVIATIDEDANSSLDTISPSAPRGKQVVDYAYDPGNPLPHGGGTDAISIFNGRILISASAPGTQGVKASGPAEMPAVYRATLTHRAGTDKGVARLTALFYDGAKATVANTAKPTPSRYSPSPPSWCPSKTKKCTIPRSGASTTLDLTDPDSNEIVPAGVARFGGDFVLDSQGDEQLIYVHGTGKQQRLQVLYMSQSIDDTAYITSRSGTLYATDQTHNDIVAITGPFQRDEAVVSATPSGANNVVNVNNYMATVSLRNGTVTAIPGLRAVQSTGLQFVAPSA